MTVTIGKLTGSQEPETWADDGDLSRLRVKYLGASILSALILREQLRGYIRNPAEKSIAIASSVDATRNGFYVVRRVSSDWKPDAVGGLLPFDLELERQQGYAYPLVEMLLSGKDRVGTPAGVTPTAWHCTPATWEGYDYGGGISGYTVRHGEGADVWYRDSSIFYGSPILSVTAGADPTHFYDAAVQLYSGAGTFFAYPIIGRQIVNDVTTWELSNSFVRVRAVTGATDILKVAVSAGAGYSTDVTFKLTSDGGTTFWGGDYVRSITVLRNGPERISIRLAIVIDDSNSTGVAYLDLTLRRGSRYVQGLITSTAPGKWGIAFSPGAAIAAVDANGGARMRTATTSGHSFLIATGGAGATVSWNNAAGRANLNANGTQFDFGIGAEINTAGPAADPDRGTDLRDQYFAAVTEQQWVVAQ